MNYEVDPKIEQLALLNCGILSLRNEMVENPELGNISMRWMREGIAIFLDELGPNLPQIWLSPTLRFNPDNVSIERVEKGKVMATETTPGGVELWINKAPQIVATIGAYLRQ